ncbi:MAG: CNP1-like family protein [Pseudomonadota bacterium]
MATAEHTGRPAAWRHGALALVTLACTGLLLCTGPATAGVLMGPPEGGYKEDAAPPPPAYSIDKTIPIELPPGSNLSFGVDPETVTLGADGIVRYVVVARSTAGSAVSASYEGIRCASAEVKVYARHYTDGNWRPVAEPVWQSLYDAAPSRASLPIAKAGACQDASPNGSPRQIIQDLKGNALYRRP